MVQGDRLDVTKTPTTTSTGMYIWTAAATRTLRRAAAVYGASPLSFVAERTQRYYIVVDSDSPTITSSFTISVAITPNQTCVPNGSTCDAGVVTQCTSAGTVLSSMTCAYGCGNPTACAPAPTSNDTCATATPITASTVILDSYGRYTGNLNPGSTCAKQSASGPDGVYAVTLPQGTVLTARLIASDPTVNPSLYLITNAPTPRARVWAAQRLRPHGHAEVPVAQPTDDLLWWSTAIGQSTTTVLPRHPA
ncbi:MAG: hypothetical protein R3E66_02530 [bacterium]